MSKSVLLAGLLGGVLGAVASFVLARSFPQPAKQEPPAQQSEARTVGDQFVAKLRAGKYDEFTADLKAGMVDVTEQQFTAFKTEFNQSRVVFAKLYGQPTGEFELLRETALSPSLTRLAYLEKFAKGGVVWFFVLYNGPEGWKLAWVSYEKLANSFAGLS